MLNRDEGVFPFTAAYKQNLERNVLALMPPPPTRIKWLFIQLQVGANQIFTYSLPNPFQGWFGIPHDVLTEEKWVFCLRAYLSWDMTKVSYSPIQTCNLAT